MHSASQGRRLGHPGHQLVAHCYQMLRLGYSSLVMVCQTVILKEMDQEDVIPLQNKIGSWVKTPQVLLNLASCVSRFSVTVTMFLREST